MLRVYAFDPGKATGMARFTERSGIVTFQFGTHPPEQMLDWLWMDIAADPFERTIITAERFVAQSLAHTNQPDALETIGALKFIARRMGATFELQSRATRNRASAESLDALGPFSTRHERDAAAHLLVTLTRHGRVDVVRSLGTVDTSN